MMIGRNPPSRPRRLLHPLLFGLIPGGLLSICLVVSHWVPGTWWVELLGLAMPLVLVSVLVVLVAALMMRPPLGYRILPLLAFVAAIKPMREAFALRLPKARGASDLTVMSFNSALFNPYRPSTLESDPGLYDSFYAYLCGDPAPDVLCIQEFYHSNFNDELTVDSILHLGGYGHFFTNPQYDEDYGGLVGVMTFSKYPAVASGRVDLGQADVHNAHWNDFVIGTDTVRIFNIQLRSMSIRWTSHENVSPLRSLRMNLVNFHDRLLYGYRARKKEMASIEAHLAASPHPVIICADLNALPWSDTYQRLKRNYHNAFEHAGAGFGHTYHHFPWFIRIDHQFYDRRIGIRYFRTLDEIDISDHYPIEAGYMLGGDRR